MSGVKVKFLNHEEIVPKLKAIAQELLASRADIIEVSLFGSLVRGNYGPHSDADIYILLEEDLRRFTDRIQEFLTHFSGIGCPVEVFPYTVKEVKGMEDNIFIKSIQKEKVILSCRS